MKFKVGDVVEVIKPDGNKFLMGDVYTIIEAFLNDEKEPCYRRSDEIADICYEYEIRHYRRKLTKLNRKLYPTYIEIEGHLYPPEMKGRLGDEI